MILSKIRMAVAALAACLCTAAFAQAFPTKPVRIIIPYSAGTATDITGRLIAKALSEKWGVNAYVENIPGGGGVIGTEKLVAAAPDGYTVGILASTHAMNRAIYPNLPYDPIKDFTPVTGLTETAMVIVAYPPAFKTIKDLFAAAKANPGQINYGSTGNGSLPHLVIELMRQSANISMTHIPYRATGQLVPDLIAGRVVVAAVGVATADPLIKAGRLTPLAVTTPKRSPLLPDTPALAESLPGYDVTIWTGLVMPKNAPKAIVDKLNTDIRAVMAEAEMKTSIDKLGVSLDLLSAQQFWARAAREVPMWTNLVRDSGAKID
jgi:tripartite-type tricarboxylate transporter receptor subunit TctC